jgi:hypothetical protein
VSGPPRIKPSALSAQRLASESRGTVRWIGAMLVTGKRPPRWALHGLRRELEEPPLAKTWRDLIVASIAYADIDLLAAELRQQGECRPVEKARDMLAADYGHASGAALGKWLQRTLEQK